MCSFYSKLKLLQGSPLLLELEEWADNFVRWEAFMELDVTVGSD